MHNDHTTFGPVGKKALPKAAALGLLGPPKLSARLPLNLGIYGLTPGVLAPDWPSARRLLLVHNRRGLSRKNPLPGETLFGDFQPFEYPPYRLALPPGQPKTRKFPKPKGNKRPRASYDEVLGYLELVRTTGELTWPSPVCPAELPRMVRCLEHGIYPSAHYRCRRNDCTFCASRNVTLLARAIKRSHPKYFFCITQMADNWSAIKAFMDGLARYLRYHTGHQVSWCYSVEPNPEGTGYHLHGYSHNYLDDRHMTDYCLAHGAGLVGVERVPAKAKAHYFGYPMGTMRLDQYPTRDQAVTAREAYRRLNGTLLAHHSRDFFRDRQGKPMKQTEATTYTPPAPPLPIKVNRPKFLARPTTERLRHPLSREAFNEAMADDEAKTKPFQAHRENLHVSRPSLCVPVRGPGGPHRAGQLPDRYRRTVHHAAARTVVNRPHTGETKLTGRVVGGIRPEAHPPPPMESNRTTPEAAGPLAAALTVRERPSDGLLGPVGCGGTPRAAEGTPSPIPRPRQAGRPQGPGSNLAAKGFRLRAKEKTKEIAQPTPLPTTSCSAPPGKDSPFRPFCGPLYLIGAISTGAARRTPTVKGERHDQDHGQNRWRPREDSRSLLRPGYLDRPLVHVPGPWPPVLEDICEFPTVTA